MSLFKALLIAGLLFSAGCVRMDQRYLLGSAYDRAAFLFEKGELLAARDEAQKIGREDRNYKASRRLLGDVNSVLSQISRRYLELGEDYERAGIYEKALEEYNRSLLYNPTNVLAKMRLAELAEALGGKSLPLTEIDKAEVKKRIAKREEKKEERERKERESEKEDDPEVNANVHYLKGKLYYESRAYAKAIEEFNTVLRHIPAFMDTKDLLSKAKKERDRLVDGHLKKGMTYFQAEEMELAIKEWDAALELDPGNKKASDYRSRAVVVLERLKNIREKQSNGEEKL